MPLLNELRFALRSLFRAKGLSATVLTLALGIGTKCLDLRRRPLACCCAAGQPRRSPDHLHPPERARQRRRQRRVFRPRDPDLRGRMKTVSSIGDFAQSASPWSASASRGNSRGRRRRLVARRDGPAPGARTPAERGRRRAEHGGSGSPHHRFWTTGLHGDPGVIGKTSGSAPARPWSSACWSRRCRIPPKPRSSPTSSPARTTCRRPW